MEIYESYNVINTLSLWLIVSAIDGQIGKTFFLWRRFGYYRRCVGNVLRK